MARTIETMLSLDEASGRILESAEPGEPVEVSLVDALGLVLAEPAVADVDLPAFDRASRDGYAVRSSEARAGSLLRVAGGRWSRRALEAGIEAGEAIRIDRGGPMPAGADAVVRLDDVRPDPEVGPTRVIEILPGIEPGRGVSRRGGLLGAGSIIAPAGTRLRAPMVGLLASQGCVHPVCHRRVRVAVVAVGSHLVGPGEAPVMHRERNAAGAAVVALAIRAGAMPHDLQAVPEARLRPALERASLAPVIVVLAPPTRSIVKELKSFGVEPVVRGVAIAPGGRSRSGVIRDGSGRVAHHVFHLPLAPAAASTAFALLARPLIDRLQGNPTRGPSTIAAAFDGTHPATANRLRAVPVVMAIDDEGRNRARPIRPRGAGDLPAFAGADGLALLPANSGPWTGGEVLRITSVSG